MDRSSTEDHNIDMMMDQYSPNPSIRLVYADPVFDYSTKIKTILNFKELFTTDHKLGAGEFGVTYLIRGNNNRPYALKISIFEGDDPDIQQEIKALIYFATPKVNLQIIQCLMKCFMNRLNNY